MVAAFDYCLHGKGGAAPSIDTAMHGLVDAAHVDHLHPDAGIAHRDGGRRRGADRGVFGDRVVWVPWRRPGFQLGLDIAAIKARQPAGDRLHPRRARHHRLGRRPASECEANCLRIIRDRRGLHRRTHGDGRAVRRPCSRATSRCREDERRARAAALAPMIRGLASTDRPQVGHFTDSDVVLDFVARRAPARSPSSAPPAPTTSCAPRSSRWSSTCRRTPPLEDAIARLRELHAAYRADYAAYYERHADAGQPRDARRRPGDRAGARRRHVQLRQGQADRPGGRGVLRQRHQRHARRRGDLAPTPRSTSREKFRIEYWALEEAKLQRMPKPKPLATRVALVTGAASGIGRAIASGSRPRAPASSSPTSTWQGRRRRPPSSAAPTSPSASRPTSPTATQVRGRGRPRRAGLRRRRPRGQQRRPLDLQAAAGDHRARLGPAARRHGQGLVPGLPGGGAGDDRPGDGRRHRLHRLARTRVFAGPNNVAYGATKADQAHQVRLLAAELGEHGIRVNGINPDGVVRGSGIFAGGWGAKRAAVYGVAEEDLGEFYAQRTLLKREVLPEHVRRRRVRAHRTGPHPDHRPARPGRRRRRRGVPALRPVPGTTHRA